MANGNHSSGVGKTGWITTFVRENPTSTAPTTRRDRERELRPLVDRLLADASAIGIPFHEVMQYLKSRVS